VVELQKHLELERQLRKVTERMLRETEKAVAEAASSHAQQARVLAEANRLQVGFMGHQTGL